MHQARILIVDDSPSDILVLSELLKDLAGLAFATSGEQALRLARDEHFDTILLDVKMPGMDGFELCRRLREGGIGTSIIFVSSLDDVVSEELGLTVGAVDYIAKPIVPGLLRARVRNHLMLSRAHTDLRKANERLVRLAAVDHLTGASSLRHFMEMAEQEIGRADRHGQPLALLMLDLDHFKAINDTQGHAAGDETLVAAVTAWQEGLRAEDLLGRLGGEEFGVLLPQTELDAAVRAADRLLKVTRRLTLPASGGGCLSISVSIGIAARQPCCGGMAMLMRKADQALYAAKAAGRDQAVVASGDTEEAMPRGSILRPALWRGRE